MHDAFENLQQALIDLWEHIRTPFDWIVAHPQWIVVYGLLCLLAIILDRMFR